MITRRTALALLASVFVPAYARASYTDPTYFKEKREKGELPDIAERLPKNPRVIDMKALGREPGKHG
ncbi:hypothetical protein, partial [Staphylococcus aureus]